MNRREFFLKSLSAATLAHTTLAAQGNLYPIPRLKPIYERLGTWYAEIRREINWNTRPIEVKAFYLKLMPHPEGRYEERNVLTRLQEAKLVESPALSPFIGAQFHAVRDLTNGKFVSLITLAFDNLVRVAGDFLYFVNGNWVPLDVAEKGILLDEDLEMMHHPERPPGTILSF